MGGVNNHVLAKFCPLEIIYYDFVVGRRAGDSPPAHGQSGDKAIMLRGFPIGLYYLFSLFEPGNLPGEKLSVLRPGNKNVSDSNQLVNSSDVSTEDCESFWCLVLDNLEAYNLVQLGRNKYLIFIGVVHLAVEGAPNLLVK